MTSITCTMLLLLQALSLLSLFLLSALGHDDPINCNQDSDCPLDKPYCNDKGHCSFCLPPDSPPPLEYCKEWIDQHGEPIFVEHALLGSPSRIAARVQKELSILMRVLNGPRPSTAAHKAI